MSISKGKFPNDQRLISNYFLPTSITGPKAFFYIRMFHPLYLLLAMTCANTMHLKRNAQFPGSLSKAIYRVTTITFLKRNALEKNCLREGLENAAMVPPGTRFRDVLKNLRTLSLL